MAGDNDSHRIPVVRHPNRPVGTRVPNSFSNVAVAARLAVRNLKQRLPACKLEAGSAEIERNGKLAALPRKILVEFAEKRREHGLRLLKLSCAAIRFLHASFKLKPHQPFCGSGQEKWPHRRSCSQAKQIFHDALQDSTRRKSSRMCKNSDRVSGYRFSASVRSRTRGKHE